MTAAKKIKSQSINKSEYSGYLEKAFDFYRGMKSELELGNWSTAALAAIHCAISIADALTVFYGAVRSTSANHLDAVELFRQHIKAANADEQARRLRRILSQKSLIEYIGGAPSRKETENLIEQAERFYRWALELLPKK